MLNPGRGNRNWVAAKPRGAFFTLGQFAITEGKRVVDLTDLSGVPARGRDCRAAERRARDADYLMPPAVLVCLEDPALGAGEFLALCD